MIQGCSGATLAGSTLYVQEYQETERRADEESVVRYSKAIDAPE
jgi:hypothetical protein